MTRLLVVISHLAFPLLAFSGDEWSVGVSIPAAQRISVAKIDHSSWNAMLQKYVDHDGLVDYQNWKRDDVAALDTYLKELSRADLDAGASREAQLAYWINAYNAVTVRGILREYPTSSIRNHTAKLWGYNIWKQLFLKVDGKQFSLDSIEHKVLRPMGEPRIHFAIVCASIGCPRLLNEAYVAATLDEQLTRNATDFFSRKQNFQVNGNRVAVSSILDWFGEDFGNSTSAVQKRIAKYVPKRHQPLLESGRGRISYLDYDWNLNDQK